MKLLIFCIICVVNLSFSSGRRYQLLPQQSYYVNPAHAGHYNPYAASYFNPSQAGYLNPSQTGYLNPSQTRYLNQATTSSLYNGYTAGFPYSPSYLYTPGINSQLLNPALSYDHNSHLKSVDPTTLTKSHVQFRPQDVIRNSQSSLGSILTPYPSPFIQQTLVRSLCSSCSCDVDVGCSENCDKCSALCDSCSCEESRCRYNCDKCLDVQSSEENETTEMPNEDTTNSVDQTTEMPNEDTTNSVEETTNSVEETTNNLVDDTTDNTDDSSSTESADVDSTTQSQTEEAATEESVTETSDVESASEATDEEDTVVSEEGGEDNEEVVGGLINPTFPLGSVGDTEIAEAGLGSSSDTDDNTEASVTESSADNNSSDCAPLESLDANLCSWGPSCQAVVNAVYPTCNYNCATCKINKIEGCVASSGSAAGYPCIFPFIYNGVAYNGCAPLHSEERVLDFWCSTKTDINGIHITGPFDDPGKYVGMCDAECPRDIPGFRVQPGFKIHQNL